MKTAREAELRPDRLRLRVRTRYLQMVFYLGTAAFALFGAWVCTTDQTGRSDPTWWMWAVGFAIFAMWPLWYGVRAPFRGLDADRDGIRVTNTFRRVIVPWEDLKGISFAVVENPSGVAAFERLYLITPSGGVVVDGVGGSPEPGGYLDSARTQLLRMQEHDSRHD